MPTDDTLAQKEMDARQNVIITNRDVYELLLTHITNNTAWQTAHAASDSKSFNALNIKFYGILAGLITVLIALTGSIHI